MTKPSVLIFNLTSPRVRSLSELIARDQMYEVRVESNLQVAVAQIIAGARYSLFVFSKDYDLQKVRDFIDDAKRLMPQAEFWLVHESFNRQIFGLFRSVPISFYLTEDSDECFLEQLRQLKFFVLERS